MKLKSLEELEKIFAVVDSMDKADLELYFRSRAATKGKGKVSYIWEHVNLLLYIMNDVARNAEIENRHRISDLEASLSITLDAMTPKQIQKIPSNRLQRVLDTLRNFVSLVPKAMIEKIYSVYVITSPSKKHYVGITKNLNRRLKEHQRTSSKCLKLKNSIVKHGFLNHRIDILFSDITKDFAETVEMLIIQSFDLTRKGLNIVNSSTPFLTPKKKRFYYGLPQKRLKSKLCS